jgi:hypothetical protein
LGVLSATVGSSLLFDTEKEASADFRCKAQYKMGIGLLIAISFITYTNQFLYFPEQKVHRMAL